VIVETNGLLSNHLPQSNETIQSWQEMEESLRLQHNYDSNAGCKIPDIIQQSTSVDLLDAQQWSDPEFTFDGAASPFIIEAWRLRLARMTFRNYSLVTPSSNGYKKNSWTAWHYQSIYPQRN
jgi:hypothetical protein